MTEYKLKGKRIVELVPERELVLEYFMLKDIDEVNKSVSYGAEIRKTEAGNNEIETVKGITDSKEMVTDLIDILLENIVTPISMVDVIDDYITEKVCS